MPGWVKTRRYTRCKNLSLVALNRHFEHAWPSGAKRHLALAFFLNNELRHRHIKASSKAASRPAGIIRAGFFAPVYAPACGRPKGSFNFAGLLARPMLASAIFLLFPCSTLLFSAISRLRFDFIADLHFAGPHLQGFTGDRR
jgi:hypothetical protein